MDQLRPKTGNYLEIFFLSIFEYYVFLIFQTNSIMSQNNLNYLHNKKEGLVSVAWEIIVSAHGAATDQSWESLGLFLFIYILLISRIPNVSNKFHH